ncbi:putative transcriptional regulatory protein, GntR family, with a PLP-dependent aminotransferase domain; signal peptide [Bradyrhizobium sp. ORS 285]|uniref:MocR-like pyridoxine biosynthesis transcription factor PdxR n=1 Tax=Bradyrhizobium sp. ORS 285 TaxID=115808 RepID=UPI000240AB0C|nr:PLP-dependent aminotransferase family protein [Bradyrhizobium sp. ORS 285]CCD84112.1 putative transcriptional regulatory protein, GntR family, with a PLP-dependent aminotransferase domain; signal peptide [Bradyrhizobium sp. ORS 285]SMX60627.1 putative transcriptional regulatory protein, GntR family, with a PLP-dependent aminotransferase domain; signal peptide [Bradyrhizobium sp. ORS 285]
MPNPATTSRRRDDVLALPIRLDRAIRGQSQQVHSALRSAIVDGLLAPGLRLPSTRGLAEQLGVRRNAIVAAYEALLSDGLVEARHGAGTFVAAQLPAPQTAAPVAELDIRIPSRGAFALGVTLVDPVLLKRLAAASRRRIATAAPDDLGYGDPRGSLHLRTQVAHYLAANRGVRCDPSCILIVSGTQHGLRLCIDALLKPGDAVWFEDPGYVASRHTLSITGAKLVPVPVDDEGLVVSAGEKAEARAKAVYVTPSHQFPTGVAMSMARRIALLDWARKADAYIFEDDYDSEYRFAGPPLTALAGIGAERVIYLGTFGKTLFAGLRLGYLVVPPALVARVVAARAAQDRFPPVFMQDALADLMADGVIAAHMRRMRPRYRQARDVVAEALVKHAKGTLHLSAPAQGLHLLATLPPGTPKGAAKLIRERAGIECRLLSDARILQRGPDGFILGYSGFAAKDLADAARRLGRATQEVLQELSSSRRQKS